MGAKEAMKQTGYISRVRHSILQCIGALAASAVLVITGCTKPQPPKTDQEISGEFPTSSARNTVTIFTTAGIKTTEIFSDSVVNYASKDSTQAYILRVNFYDKDGLWTSLLTADSGVIREKTEMLEVFGDVRVITRDSVRLTTTQLAWDPKISKIISDSFVTAQRGGDIIRGYGMVSDPDLKNIIFKRQISGQMQLEEDSL